MKKPPLKELIHQLKQEKVIFSIVLVISAIMIIRPIMVEKNGVPQGTIWLWPWSSIRINFTNSVTGKPVEIRCSPLWKFSRFSARTDPETEAYYTGGSYGWNDKLAKEHTSHLNFCSVKGVTICIDRECFLTDEGCLSLKLLWP
ncbi:MAG: hypothetical protein ACP5TY_09175 [Thermodesulforhabdaceae bacterium]